MLYESVDTETMKNTIDLSGMNGSEWVKRMWKMLEIVVFKTMHTWWKVLTCTGSCVCSVSHPSLLYRNIDTVTRCARKVMRLTTLCTNRQCCCLTLHMSVRLTRAVDSVGVWTCYSCYAIVERVWSEVVFVRCVTKMDQQNFDQSYAIKCCVKRGESATVTWKVTKGLWRTFSIKAQVFRWYKSFLEVREVFEDEPCAGRLSTSKTDDTVKIWGLLWGQIVEWLWEWSVVSYIWTGLPSIRF
jgi:hypothetical protein